MLTLLYALSLPSTIAALLAHHVFEDPAEDSAPLYSRLRRLGNRAHFAAGAEALRCPRGYGRERATRVEDEIGLAAVVDGRCHDAAAMERCDLSRPRHRSHAHGRTHGGSAALQRRPRSARDCRGVAVWSREAQNPQLGPRRHGARAVPRSWTG